MKKVRHLTEEHKSRISNALKGHPIYKSISRNNKLRIAQLGRKFSEETKEKFRLRKVTEETKNKIRLKLKNRSISHETRLKISLSKKGKSSWNKGKKLTEEHRRKISEAQIGDKSSSWRGGSTKIKRINNYFWRELRKFILIRDDYRCQNCLSKYKILNCHHKIPYRFTKDDSVNNLIMLCVSCHIKEEYLINKEIKNLTLQFLS